MRTATKPIKPNPLGKLVTAQLRPLMRQVDKVSGGVFVDADWSEGYAFDEGCQVIGSAPDRDCLTIEVGFAFSGSLDATRPLIPQLVKWLGGCVAELDSARIGIGSVKETRDIGALRELAMKGQVNR